MGRYVNFNIATLSRRSEYIRDCQVLSPAYPNIPTVPADSHARS